MPTEPETLNELKKVLEQQHREWSEAKDKKREILASLESSLVAIKNSRPNDRSELDRRYAIVITDFEKAMALYKSFIVDEYLLSGILSKNVD